MVTEWMNDHNGSFIQKLQTLDRLNVDRCPPAVGTARTSADLLPLDYGAAPESEQTIDRHTIADGLHSGSDASAVESATGSSR